jgi:hypothetical protein
MSLTAMTWCLLAISLSAASVSRPVWALSVYMLTFFAAPSLWWWGDELPELRYSLISGFILLVSVLLHGTHSPVGYDRTRLASKAAIVMLVNATFVHFMLAANQAVALEGYIELLKFVLLYFLLAAAIKNRNDMHIALVALALGAAYIGYEVTINERGEFTAGRLEGVGAPGADTANGLASMLLLVLPLFGTLLLDGKKWHKMVVAIAAPLALNVVILCNSRGAFLGLIGAALTFVFLSRGQTRKTALRVVLLGSFTFYMLMGDPEILERFLTTFSGAEERDRSAASRLEFWSAGWLMLQDYPLGAGSGAFKYVLGDPYLAKVGSDQTSRSLHNGYLTEATDWGVQGLIIKFFFMGGAIAAAYRTMKRCRDGGRTIDALVGISFLASVVGFMIVCIFGSYLGNEWAFWIAAFLVRYGEIYAEPKQVPANVGRHSPAAVRTPGREAAA